MRTTKHGGTSVALAATSKPGTGGRVAGEELRAHVGPRAAEAFIDAVDPRGDGRSQDDVRRLIGKGFRNLAGPPSDNEVFRYKGKPIDHTPAVQEPLRVTLMKLAYALESDNAGRTAPPHGDADKAGRRDVDPGDNPNIPSGYAYLLQLVAHDLVQSTSSLAQTDDGRIALNNNRSRPLRLESIYGGGPDGSRLLYEARLAAPNTPNAYLRLGPLDTKQAYTCPFRDLARVDLSRAIADVKHRVQDPKQTPVSSSAPPPPTGASGSTVPVRLPDVLVGDARNDDHALISQLTVVFHLLHNGLVKRAENDVPFGRHADNAAEAAMDRYYFARMASTLIFRNVLRTDVMKRLLHPAVYQLYSGQNPPTLGDWRGTMPLEFTHGALRVCHAMLRDEYRFNDRNSFLLKDVLARNSSSDSTITMPMPDSWAVAWSYFFDIDPAKREQMNLSKRLRPRYDKQTQARVFFEDFDQTTKKPGLAYRDMLSAALAGLWSVPAMLRRLATEPGLGEILRRARLADPAVRTSGLKEWLTETCLSGDLKFDDDEVTTLAEDPPLPFFLMFEAMNDPDCRGLRLGPLGSVIVAEVVFGILNSDPIVPADKTLLEDQLRYLETNVLGTAIAKWSYAGLDSMPGLVGYVAKLNALTATEPPFI